MSKLPRNQQVVELQEWLGFDHCAACCAGSLIAEYDHDCPIPEHREWALIQFPPSMRLAAAEVEP